MTKLIKRAALLIAAFAIPAGVALAQSGPPYGWRSAPPNSYYSGTQVDRSKVDAAVKQTLKKAVKGQSWTNPNGVKFTSLLVDKQIVGQYWEEQESDPEARRSAVRDDQKEWPDPEKGRTAVRDDQKEWPDPEKGRTAVRDDQKEWPDPEAISVGSYWAGSWGTNALLVKGGKVVGTIWVK